MNITCEIYKESFSADLVPFLKNPRELACFRFSIGNDVHRSEFILTQDETKELILKATKSFDALEEALEVIQIKES